MSVLLCHNTGFIMAHIQYIKYCTLKMGRIHANYYTLFINSLSVVVSSNIVTTF